MVILGTQYAGEMKKGILTLMMYQVYASPSTTVPSRFVTYLRSHVVT
jgi:ATP-dependent phosphoenolpyruvate carboxykinase